MTINTENYQIDQKTKLGTIFLIVGLAGLCLSAIGLLVNAPQFYHSYLISVVFWLSISLGGMFVIMVHYLTGATWSTVLRRIVENFIGALPVMAILFIPILFGIHELYHWSDLEAVAHDHLLQEKAPYLNIPFFIIRTVLYFTVWIFLSLSLRKKSLNQDNAAIPTEVVGARKMSAYGVILFALTVSFASFDWLMSLDPHWYSTIFGVYFFSGCSVAIFSTLSLTIIILDKKGLLAGIISTEHYHDLGRLLFTFVVFWSYIAFSQYFLIWYANIPEETIFFLHRWEGSWKIVSVLLGAGHFVIPFLILLIRSIKRNFITLGILAAWIFLMHYIDIYWLVMPSLHHHAVHISWIDFSSFIGVGGIFLWMFWRNMTSAAIIPVNDPRLEASINIKN
jgi:hypothetical protein